MGVRNSTAVGSKVAVTTPYKTLCCTELRVTQFIAHHHTVAGPGFPIGEVAANSIGGSHSGGPWIGQCRIPQLCSVAGLRKLLLIAVRLDSFVIYKWNIKQNF